jgi:NAD(P)-dependent dehydrogenase (short-subunit alcohol dehydrogenase family)
MRILITGASRGIGAAVCRRLAADARDGRLDAGLQIAACASTHGDELAALAADIEGEGVSVAALNGDLSDPDVPARLVSEAVAAFGGLDAVVANAGMTRTGNLLATTLEDWDRVFAVNLRSVWLLCKAAHGPLADSGGSIVTIASMSAGLPQPGLGPYSVTKSGVVMLTRLMAQEWTGDGIRVNSVSPGMVITPMTEANYEDADFKARREAMVPAGRIADPLRDIAGVVAFLLGPDAGYLSGHDILADGGVSDSMLRILPARKV